MMNIKQFFNTNFGMILIMLLQFTSAPKPRLVDFLIICLLNKL